MYSNLFFAIQNTSKPIRSRSIPYPTDNLRVCINSITVNSWGNAPKCPKVGKVAQDFSPGFSAVVREKFAKAK